jgi:hypothetical protein
LFCHQEARFWTTGHDWMVFAVPAELDPAEQTTNQTFRPLTARSAAAGRDK